MKKTLPWIILTFVFIATGLNFLDRQVLSMTILRIQSEFGISDVQYGMINTSFLISYAIMFTVAGRIIDTVGGKAGLALSVGIWSIASCLHGVMSSFYQLLAFRFLLGIGEGGCFPGAAKTVVECFGKNQRAFANGVAIGGSAIGAVIAPPLTLLISEWLGWRWSFIIPGIIGLLWVAGWLAIPWKNVRLQDNNVNEQPKISFWKVIRQKQAIVFIVIRFLLDPVMYFIMFWTPKYLHEQNGAGFEKIGKVFWIPFLALGIANIAGGWASDSFVRRGYSINKARKLVMGIAAGMTMMVPLITQSDSVQMAIVLISVIMFAHGFWITNYITSISDVFGAHGTSTVVGLSGTAGAISGLILNPLIGLAIQHYSYDPVWIACGFMYPLAFIILLLFIPKIKPV
jgi:ACS family hexuronate transporter-like MFS transporter